MWTCCPTKTVRRFFAGSFRQTRWSSGRRIASDDSVRVDARGRRERERAMLDRIEVRESRIHGKGIFALRRLREGQRIGRFEGETTTQNGTYVLWLIGEDGSEIGIRGRNALRFLNHAKPENAEFVDAELYVIRNVQPGAEILIDYGEGWTN
jgi:hypothetical protein